MGNYNASALAVSGSNVYVGGSFGMVDGLLVHASNIAKWNGVNWSALGSGTGGNNPSGDVLALAVSGNDLYIGGDFTTAGGFTANHVAKWNGTSWTAVARGTERVGRHWASACPSALTTTPLSMRSRCTAMTCTPAAISRRLVAL